VASLLVITATNAPFACSVASSSVLIMLSMLHMCVLTTAAGLGVTPAGVSVAGRGLTVVAGATVAALGNRSAAAATSPHQRRRGGTASHVKRKRAAAPAAASASNSDSSGGGSSRGTNRRGTRQRVMMHHYDPIDIHTVETGATIMVDERVAKGWDGGHAVVLPGGVHFRGKDADGRAVSKSHKLPTGEEYIKVHLPGSDKRSFEVVTVDTRVHFNQIDDSGFDDGIAESPALPPARCCARAASQRGAASGATTPAARELDESGSESEGSGSGDENEWNEGFTNGSTVHTGVKPMSRSDSSASSQDDSADSEEIFDDEHSEDISFNYDFDKQLTITIFDSKFSIYVRGVSKNSVATKSPEMLAAVLAKLVPLLEGQCGAEMSGSDADDNIAQRMSLKWMWHDNTFRMQMRTLNEKHDGKLSKEKKSGIYTESTLKRWRKITKAATRDDSGHSRTYEVKIKRCSRDENQYGWSKKAAGKRSDRRGAAKQQKQCQDEAMEFAAIYSFPNTNTNVPKHKRV